MNVQLRCCVDSTKQLIVGRFPSQGTGSSGGLANQYKVIERSSVDQRELGMGWIRMGLPAVATSRLSPMLSIYMSEKLDLLCGTIAAPCKA